MTDTGEVDHIVPLSQDGDDRDESVQYLCVPCHEKKSIMEKGHKPKQAVGIDGWPIP